MQSTQSGMSLVEVMLASALGLFLMFGFIQIYLSVQKTFNLQQTIISIQESGRFAVHFLETKIRMAGYAYCDSKNNFVNADLAMHGYNKALPDFLKNNTVKKNTDVIVVGECVTRDKKTKFEQLALFVSPTSRKNKLGKTIYALYEKNTTSNKRELVSGVEEMKISYGVVDETGDKDIFDYVAADKVQDWKKVRAVNIALLIGSEFPALTKPESYEFAGIKLPADRFLHREWHTTIANRELH